jgi:hypothetical protein
MQTKLFTPILALAFLSTFNPAFAQGTAFTYQGRLNDGGSPANGYYDLTFSVWTNASGPLQTGATLINTAVAVSNGVFAVTLDFGPGIFTGNARWLEISARTNGSSGAFATLSPRQPLTATPYALFAPNAGTASTAVTASNVPWSAVTGIPAGFADGIDNDTTYSAGVGMSLTGTTFSIANGGVGSAQLADGAVGTNKLSTAGAVAGQIFKYNGTAWTLAADSDTAYSAGTGLALNGTQFSVSFAGSGSAATAARSDHDHAGVYAPNLHTHSGADITSGTVSDARLSANIPRLDGNQSFSGTNRFSGVTILTNAPNAFAGQFSGDGGGLTNLNGGVLTAGSVNSNALANDAVTTTKLADGGVTTVKMADGSVTAAKIASGQVVKLLNGLTDSVQIVGGTNVTVGTNGSSIRINSFIGSGGLVLPFNQDQSASGNTLFRIGNLSDGTAISGESAGGWGVFGRSQTNIGVFGQTIRGTFSGVLGRNEDTNSAGGAGVFGYASSNAIGVLAISEGNDGLSGRSNAEGKSGVFGYSEKNTGHGGYFLNAASGAGLGGESSGGTGVEGFSTTGWGMFGRSQTNIGVFGQTFGDSSPGVLGRNDGATGTGGSGVFGYAASAAAGVLAVSEGGDGLSARSNADGKSGVFAYSDKTNGFAGYFWNAGGGEAIHGEGKVRVNGTMSVNAIELVDNYLSTPTSQPLEFRVNSQRALRLEPTPTNGAVNVIGGSSGNYVAPGVVAATIGGGGALNYQGASDTNAVTADFGTVAGGASNSVRAISGTIGGGAANRIQPGSEVSTIAGGNLNAIQGAYIATIGGGDQNTIQNFADHATIAGGGFNTIVGSFALPVYSTISGGFANTIQTNVSYATIGGGARNTIQTNAAYATIPGGQSNQVTGSFSFAAGRNARAIHNRAFVWNSYTNPGPTFIDDRFHILAQNGLSVDFSTQRSDGGGNKWLVVFDDPTFFIATSTGASLTTAGVWSNASDKNRKTDFKDADARAVLDKLAALPVRQWRYTNEIAGTRHIGPTAQDFSAAFGLGSDDKSIGTVDEGGVALAAIQGLNQKLTEELKRRDAENAELKQQLAALEQDNEEREARLARLEKAAEAWNGTRPGAVASRAGD